MYSKKVVTLVVAVCASVVSNRLSGVTWNGAGPAESGPTSPTSGIPSVSTPRPPTTPTHALGAMRRHRRRRRHHAIRRTAGTQRRTRVSRRSRAYRYGSGQFSMAYYHSTYRHLRYRHALYHRYLPWSPWNVSSINANPGLYDDLTGEDAEVRDAAVKALGQLNGSVVVVDPNTGRILAVVNQKLAFSRGYIPCSTVKPMVALAGLEAGLVTVDTKLPGTYSRRIKMTDALARSDNRYFAKVGEMLGFQRVRHYAELLGYGQKAALDIPDESPGSFPSEPPPAAIGGVGRLTSFGTGIDQTPLQMAAMVSAIANGGTLYWLQWPRTAEEIANFKPKVRRVLTGMTPYIPEVRQGMAGAVLYGTARSAYNPFEDIFGKTGTCSEDGGRMGWFVSFAEQQQLEYVVVVMLRGGRLMFGPHAAEVAGSLYRFLLPQQGQAAQALSPPAILSHPGD